MLARILWLLPVAVAGILYWAVCHLAALQIDKFLTLHGL